jgi:uncharacterized phosphosugar-binding protein
MLIDSYYETVDALLQKLRTTQRENCLQAGQMIADALEKGNAVHIYDTGHIINSELIYRGGGLLAYKQLKYQLNVENPVRDRDRSGVDTSMEGLSKYVLRASKALPGDLLIIGSVSGKTPNTIDLAMAAHEFGMKVIALTSVEYSSSVESLHSSGKRLFECADLVLDNCAPKAEAMMEIEGLDARFGAASGIAATYLMWSATAAAVEELLKRGIKPSVLKSANYQDGPQFNKELEEIYKEHGY